MAIVFFFNTETGATQFSGVQTDFTDQVNVNLMGPNTIPVIQSYSYMSTGAAHDAVLQLSPASGSADHLKIELENLTGINSFTTACEIPVPKLSGVSFVVLFTTTGKAATATLRINYTIKTF